MVATGYVGEAFALVIAAGASTIVGALLVFFIRQPRVIFLAISLGVAAGVMIYISFVGILSEGAVEHFKEGGLSDSLSFNLAQLCFFGGIVVVLLLEGMVNLMLWGAARWSAKKQAAAIKKNDPHILPKSNDLDLEAGADDALRRTSSKQATLEKNMADDAPDTVFRDRSAVAAGEPSTPLSRPSSFMVTAPAVSAQPAGVAMTEEQDDFRKKVFAADGQAAHLQKLGLLTALAIFIHNFPEGINVFVGTVAGGVKMGGVLAFAIAVHNIPEGICVSMPIYYATGSRWKAIMWASIAAIAEPIGGLFAYLVLEGEGQHVAYGIVFGIVSGMMVGIALKELLVTALRLDPSNRVAFWSCLSGMVIMALSLVLLSVTE